MPTVKQQQKKLKREVEDKRTTREITITTLESIAPEIEYGTKTLEVPTDVWDDPPEVMKVRKEDEGKRGWIAGTPSTFEAKIDSVNMEEGTVSMLIKDMSKSDRGAGSYRDVYLSEVIVHPLELHEERLSEFYTIEDKRKTRFK